MTCLTQLHSGKTRFPSKRSLTKQISYETNFSGIASLSSSTPSRRNNEKNITTHQLVSSAARCLEKLKDANKSSVKTPAFLNDPPNRLSVIILSDFNYS